MTFVKQTVKYELDQKTYVQYELLTTNIKSGLAEHLHARLRLLSVTTIIVTQNDTKN